MEYILRDYQEDAVKAGADFLLSENEKGGAIIVAATGSGKSLMLASIAQKIGGNTLVLQPSKEILEQNYQKAKDYGFKDIGIFSASCGRKDISKLTLATIGSIVNKKELFEEFQHLLIDECHLVNAKGGMYEEFITYFGGKVLGLTATPFRMHAYVDSFSSPGIEDIMGESAGERRVVAKFLTRTRPRIFNKIISITQIEDLYNKGFLCPVQYDHNYLYDQSAIKLNSTGADFDEKSLEKYNQEIDLVGTVAGAIVEQRHKHVLVFTSSVKEAYNLREILESKGISSATVSAKTPKKDREDILDGFKKGYIKVVSNCGTLTTGFDFPALDCIVLARPTQSVALYAQMIGRGIRIAPDKDFCKVIDVCGNVKRFGMIEMFKIVEVKPGLHRLQSNIGWLTGFDFVSNTDIENNSRKDIIERYSTIPDIVTFGKFKGTHIAKVPNFYLEWCVKNMSAGAIVEKFKGELERRNKIEIKKEAEEDDGLEDVRVEVSRLDNLF